MNKKLQLSTLNLCDLCIHFMARKISRETLKIQFFMMYNLYMDSKLIGYLVLEIFTRRSHLLTGNWKKCLEFKGVLANKNLFKYIA